MNSPFIDFFGYSDIGPVRSNNEDTWVCLPEHNFYALADGMGGHLAGEVAAKETTDHLCDLASHFLHSEKKVSLPLIISKLRFSIQKVNTRVYELGQAYPQFRGMGTTLCCLYFYSNTAIYAHIGDSRIYHFRQKLFQLTEDHSLLNKLLADKETTNQKVLKSCKNVITKAIGTTSYVDPEISHLTIEPKDLFLLCSDGLSDYVPGTEITDILQASASIQEKGKNLINRAKEKGSRDNMTVILLEVKGFDDNKKNILR
ncbi:MAG: PP2C family serine/threonine-protein phosphatase [Chlamydiota bacterium]